MRALLHLLTVSRLARRDAALIRVQAASVLLDAARDSTRQRESALLQARAWQNDLRDEPDRPGSLAWREARQLACLALAERAVQDLMASQAEVARLEDRVRERQRELIDCERALLRTDELGSIVRQAASQSRERKEQSDIDDLPHGRMSAP